MLSRPPALSSSSQTTPACCSLCTDTSCSVQIRSYKADRPQFPWSSSISNVSPCFCWHVHAGEDVPEDLKAQEKGQWQWRLGCMGRPLAGPALEDSAEELKGTANFEGDEPSETNE